MKVALYSPGEGYYEQQRQIGRGGDFFTSVSVGSLFGELLAFQFAEWFEERGIQNLQIIEAGAHDGQLAADILHWVKKFKPEIFEQMDYCILEPSSRHRDWQRKTLAEFSEKLSWFHGWSDFPRSAFPVPRFTIIFSNELFDAMPVHRLGWDAKTKTWFEWGVDWNGKSFVWKPLLENQVSEIVFPELAPELMDVLPDAFTTEVCPAAVRWWTEAASVLYSGKLLAIDYGLLAEEFLTPVRSGGTLRAFYRHHATSDLLARPGEQDITAHVNFSALQEAGESAGLKTNALISQPKFLTEIAERIWQKFGEWDATRRKQFQTLTHPEHLGRAFRVLIQSR
ncbi:MAG: SAM-dependent methyltransferase [Verrucomicrobiota bacterium]